MIHPKRGRGPLAEVALVSEINCCLLVKTLRSGVQELAALAVLITIKKDTKTSALIVINVITADGRKNVADLTAAFGLLSSI